MALPKELTTVTPLSKTIALIMFTLLPIIAFFMGIKYQQMVSNLQILLLQESIMREKKHPTPTPNQSNWKSYRSNKLDITFEYPNEYKSIKEKDNDIWMTKDELGLGTDLIRISKNRADFYSYNKLPVCKDDSKPGIECLMNSINGETISSTKIDSVSAVRFFVLHTGPLHEFEIVQTVTQPFIQIYTPLKQPNEEFQQFLSTFKFAQ